MISKILHDKIEGCESEEELEGVLWELHEFGQERSWLYAHGAHKAVKLNSTGGLKTASKILKPGYHTLSSMGSVWENYRGRRKEFPRLSFSFFRAVLDSNMPRESVIPALKEAEDNGWTVAKFQRELEKRWKPELVEKRNTARKRGKHACPVCHAVHPIGEKHG